MYLSDLVWLELFWGSKEWETYSDQLVATEWFDGFQLYANYTVDSSFKPMKITSCVPDWKLLDSTLINNPVTNEWTSK